jgi:bifunctional DNase/RNase
MKREVKILGLSYSQSQVGSYVCVLAETNGHRKLPIIIKPQDAQTIALRVEGMKSPRPMTHELFKSLSDSFMIDCQEVYIYQVLEGVFYAKLVFNNGIDDADIETTAGDAIALSLVFECPLYVSEEVLDVCGIVTDDEGNLVPDSDEVKKTKKTIKKKAEPVISVEDMKKMMEEAISNEDYELAAQYRDKIIALEMGKNS